jgi:hypothetical protein
MKAPGTWQACLETAALAALAATICVLLGQGDPALLPCGLAWLALAPALAGLRYGSSYGVACGSAQLGALVLAARSGGAFVEMPIAEIALGWLVAGLIPGVFRDAWARRLTSAEGRAADQSQRLETLARAFHALEASHDRLQRETPGTPSTLRDALEAFGRALIDSPRPHSLESLGGRVLELFREHGSAHAVTLHALDERGLPGEALAVLGACSGSGDDPLIRHAARLGEVVSVRDVSDAAGVLAAIPLVDVTGRLHAVVAIREMPFLALHGDTLGLLAVLGAHAADVLAQALHSPRRSPAHAPAGMAGPRREPSGLRGKDHGAVA